MAEEDTTARSDYAQALGARLRAIRQQQGLSLQRVEQRSQGAWKAVVVGSYERGDRAVTVADLKTAPREDLLKAMISLAEISLMRGA